MKGVLSCLLALVLALSITPSVFAEETVGGTTNNVDANNGDDTQEGVGTTTDKAYTPEETVGGTTNNVDANNGDDTQEGVGTTTDKAYTPEETVGGTTNYVNAINGDDTPEETVGGTTIYVDAINGDDSKEGVGTSDKPYKTVAAAVAAAESGDTIQLGEGNYTLYKVSSEGHTKGKNLTFVGQGTDKTGWNIGALVPDPAHFGTEYNGDYSFDGAGTITFKNMTLRSGKADYLGFIRANNTIVENCVINGKTFYWGYQTATFRNTTFNCPKGGFFGGDYAIWTYSSPVMTFDNCTFNSYGKVINVYTDYSAGSHDITVNFNGCKVNNSGWSLKPVLNINDFNMGNYKYVINISGNNTVTGVDVDRDTCSRLFGFGGKATTNNKGKTVVNFGNITVWQNGKMVDAKAYHNSGVTAGGVTYTNDVDGSNDSLYAEGYKDHALVTTYGEWSANEDGTITRDVTKNCTYCGYEEKVTEYQVKLTYDANGGEGAIDSATGAAGESVTVAENVFTRNNYTFTGWNTQADGKGTAYKAGDSFTLTDKDTVLYAQWSKNSGSAGTGTNGTAKPSAGTGTNGTAKPSAGTGTNGTAKPTDSPKTGDNSNLALWFALLFVSGGAAIGTMVVSRKKKYNR